MLQNPKIMIQTNNYDQQTFIIQTSNILICIIGVIANILAILVFSRSQLSGYSYSFYCRFLTISDSAILFHFILHMAIDNIETKDRGLLAASICLERFYVGYVLGTNSLWLLVVISLDRLITIAYPNRFSVIFKQRWFQSTLVILIAVYSLLVNLNIPLEYRYDMVIVEGTVKNASKLNLVCFMAFESQVKQSWILLVNFFLVNIIINNLLSLRIISIVIHSRKKSRRQNNVSIRDIKFAISSIALNFISFLTRMPVALGILLSKDLSLPPNQADLAFKISMLIVTFDHSLNLFINIFFNSNFYHELQIMLGIKKKPSLTYNVN